MIERVFHCDWRECEGHVRTMRTQPASSFLTVTDHEAGDELHFCSWDCLLRHAGERPPDEVIPCSGEADAA
jgi:hypothetical protein